MITLTKDDFKILIYPDGQPHVSVRPKVFVTSVRLVMSIRNPNELFIMSAMVNALRHDGVEKIELCVPYLMGARSDRLQIPGHSVDLEVVAEVINSCGFIRVVVFDVHSDAASKMIGRLHNIENKYLVEKYHRPGAIVICPDSGAYKKLPIVCSWNSSFVEYVTCTKQRDIETGRITLVVDDPKRCEGRICVIVDDICDGGGTFLAIADQIKPSHLTLIVSHGIFSKGFSVFSGKIDEIITSNSYSYWSNGFGGNPLVYTYSLKEDWYED